MEGVEGRHAGPMIAQVGPVLLLSRQNGLSSDLGVRIHS
jgi:hypothetical protein